jgi:hypothetical protein
MKRLWFLLSFFLLFTYPDLTAQDKIYVTFLSNAENEYQLSTLSKITFLNGSFKVKYNDNQVVTYQNSLIRQIAFAPYVASATEVLSFGELPAIYPNPARDFISLKNIKNESGNITIYDLNGVMVLSGTFLSSSDNFDVSSLKPGLYLLKVEGHMIKFSKL